MNLTYKVSIYALKVLKPAGLPPAEVAERAGHTVDVLLKVYAKVLDGQREKSNQKIDVLLQE